VFTTLFRCYVKLAFGFPPHVSPPPLPQQYSSFKQIEKHTREISRPRSEHRLRVNKSFPFMIPSLFDSAVDLNWDFSCSARDSACRNISFPPKLYKYSGEHNNLSGELQVAPLSCTQPTRDLLSAPSALKSIFEFKTLIVS
jgi:hypothetical protein